MIIFSLIVDSIWLFLPALVGNQLPGVTVWILAKINRTSWNAPVSARWLGKNKTWQAYPSAIAGAVVTIYLQRQAGFDGLIDYDRGDLWMIGGLFGIGIVAGDHIKSLFKRQIKNIPPGDPWWPYDQLDFVAGGLFAVALVIGWKIWTTALVLVPVVLLFNPLVNGIGYRLGLRKVPH